MATHDLTTAIRALIATVEAGTYNSAQARLLQYAKQAVGDGEGPVCLHEHTAYENTPAENDILVCQVCRARLN